MNIYVGNLAYNLSEDELKDEFSKFGEVSSVSIIMDKYSGRSKGFGFVEMTQQSEAEKAIEGLNDCAIKGRNIKVNEARSRSERPQRKAKY